MTENNKTGINQDYFKNENNEVKISDLCTQGEGQVRTTPIEQALDRQSMLTREIWEQLHSLWERLQPVRWDAIPRDCSSQPDNKKDMVKIVNKIEHTNDLLAMALETITAYKSELHL